MPDTITDRAVNIALHRRAPGEKVSQFRSRRDGPGLKALGERLATWAADHLGELKQAEPVMPVEDRAADTWEPLIAIADAASGHWPQTARAACKALVAAADEADEDRSLAAQLLRDIRTVLAESAYMFSADIIAKLTSDPESWWSNLWGKPLDQHRLAKELKGYGVRSKTLRIDGVKAKGYRVDGDDGLAQAWTRYLPTRACVAPVASQVDGSDGATHTFSTRGTRGTRVAARTTIDLDLSENATRATHATDIPPGTDKHVETAPAFVPPTCPGRCPECGWHVPTQGHSDTCSKHPDNQAPF